MRKKYGEYKKDVCPFCSKIASVKNEQGVPTCQTHKKNLLQDLKCACGDYLDVMTGKYGPYFRCFNCGNINYQKGLVINDYPLKSIEDL